MPVSPLCDTYCQLELDFDDAEKSPLLGAQKMINKATQILFNRCAKNMARREEYEISITCPRCGKRGTSTREENENPYYRGGRFDSVPHSVSDGFRIEKGSEIFCTTCNIPVE